MERITFIVADSGARISCLLNPERLVQRRVAGLRRPAGGSGPVTAPAASDDLLLHTGGGRTEIDLELLFDVELASGRQATETAPVTDVRDLTRPLWELAENRTDERTGRRVSPVRFFWGNRWNVLCLVVAVAERLERFDDAGTPTRSWLSLRLVRIPDPAPAPVEPPLADAPSPADLTAAGSQAVAADFHVALDPGLDSDGQAAGGERLDELAARYYGQPWLWRLIAAANDLFDGPFVPPGRTLVIPEAPAEVTP